MTTEQTRIDELEAALRKALVSIQIGVVPLGLVNEIETVLGDIQPEPQAKIWETSFPSSPITDGQGPWPRFEGVYPHVPCCDEFGNTTLTAEIE